MFGNIFDDKNINHISDDSIFIDGSTSNSLYNEIRIKGIEEHIPLAHNKNAVELFIPRHRSLYDYMVHMPTHIHFITPRIIFLAGNNLFVSHFDTFLRKCGGFMYLRDDSILKRKGFKNH